VCAFWFAKRNGIPLILQPHGSLKTVLGKVRLKRLYDRLFGRGILGYASRVIVLSPAEAEEARCANIPEPKVKILHNGVPIPGPETSHLRGYFRKRFHIDDNAFVVLFIGRVRASKGVFVLLDAFDAFRKRFPHAVLAICGPDGGAARRLRKLAERRGMALVLPGLITGEDKVAAFVDSDVFCLPSPMETQSVAFLEAASYGLPIVAAKTSAPKEFVESNAGLFVSLDREALAEAIAQLASSVNLRKRLGSRARTVVEEDYSIDTQVSILLELYHVVLQDTL
ncbi:MAG: glycosyltransferase family 4 protein, partial [Candidatus Methylomirabilales bacterium]